MNAFSDTFIQIVLHPLFLLVILLVIVGLIAGIVAVWMRLGSGQTSSEPAADDRSHTIQEETRAAYPGASGR